MEILRPLKAIRKHCIDCMCGQMQEVTRCPSSETCALWPYRFGKRPKTVGLVHDFDEDNENEDLYLEDE